VHWDHSLYDESRRVNLLAEFHRDYGERLAGVRAVVGEHGAAHPAWLVLPAHAGNEWVLA